MGVFSRALSRAITAITQNIFTSPHQNWLDNNGKPLAGGLLYVYAAGTATPVNTWQDAALTEINTNPVVLDGGGFTTIWLNPADTYKFRMVNRLGEQQWTIDNYQGGSLTANILVPINYLLPATGENIINNGNNAQIWQWILQGDTTTTNIGGLDVTEVPGAPSTAGPFSGATAGFGPCILSGNTVPGSTVSPFRAVTNAGTGHPNGIGVTPDGNLTLVGTGSILFPDRTGKNSTMLSQISAPDGVIDVSSGAHVTGANWTASSTDARILAIGKEPNGLYDKGLEFWSNTGLTPGQSYNPTPVFGVSGSGVISSTNLATGETTALQADALGNIIAVPLGTGTVAGIASINFDTTPAQQIVGIAPIAVVTVNGVTTISLGTALQSIAMSPASVVGGNNSTGTVTLTYPASGGGAVVILTSSNPSILHLPAPASVTVPQGATTATFTVTTSAVGVNTSATISGNFNGIIQSTSLTVTVAPPVLPIYGGYGPANNSTGVTFSGGNLVLVPYTGNTLPVLQNTAEQAGQSWAFTPATQCICLVLYGGTHTFVDQSGNNIPFVAPVPVTVNGNSMFLYSTQFLQSAAITVKVQI